MTINRKLRDIKIERKYYSLKSFKAFDTKDPNGGYEGIASPFGNLDDGGDIIMKGGYKKTLPSFLKSGWGAQDHNWGMNGQIAFPTDAKETERGLWIQMKFHSTPDAQNTRVKVNERLDNGLDVKLSIGYELDESPLILRPSQFATELPKYINSELLAEALVRAKQFSSIRVLKSLKLHEVSIVTVPMEQNAAMTGAKSREALKTKQQKQRDVVHDEFQRLVELPENIARIKAAGFTPGLVLCRLLDEAETAVKVKEIRVALLASSLPEAAAFKTSQVQRLKKSLSDPFFNQFK